MYSISGILSTCLCISNGVEPLTINICYHSTGPLNRLRGFFWNMLDWSFLILEGSLLVWSLYSTCLMVLVPELTELEVSNRLSGMLGKSAFTLRYNINSNGGEVLLSKGMSLTARRMCSSVRSSSLFDFFNNIFSLLMVFTSAILPLGMW